MSDQMKSGLLSDLVESLFGMGGPKEGQAHDHVEGEDVPKSKGDVEIEIKSEDPKMTEGNADGLLAALANKDPSAQVKHDHSIKLPCAEGCPMYEQTKHMYDEGSPQEEGSESPEDKLKELLGR